MDLMLINMSGRECFLWGFGRLRESHRTAIWSPAAADRPADRGGISRQVHGLANPETPLTLSQVFGAKYLCRDR